MPKPTRGFEPRTRSLRVKERIRLLSRQVGAGRMARPKAATRTEPERQRVTTSCARGVRVAVASRYALEAARIQERCASDLATETKNEAPAALQKLMRRLTRGEAS